MTVGIGMIGSGFMGLTYSEAIARHVRGAKLAAIAGGRRAVELAKDYGVWHAPSVEALLARDDVDAVVLATPDQNRRALTLAAAAAGKHVLAEKPMAPTIADCDAMIAACRQSGVNLAVVKTERFRKITKRAKQLIDEGVIGPIRMMRTVSSFPVTLARELFESRPWMADPAGGGLFMGMASHNTDFLRWLTGANAVKVFAQVNTFSDIKAPAQSVMAQIAFDNGVMGHLWISSEFPPPGIPSSEVRFQIVGRDGMLDLENFEFLDLGKGDKWDRIETPERFDYLKEPKSPIRLYPHIGVVQEFVDSILEKRPPRVGGAEGRAAVEICQACLISARTGAPSISPCLPKGDPSMAPHRVVVIGVGSIGERHVRCILATGRAAVSIVETKSTLADEVSRRYGVPAFADLESALAQHPTAAVVATPAPLHVPQATALVEAGLHVLIEKPLSTSLVGVEQLAERVARRKATVSVAYVYRAFPMFVSMKEALASGRFGTPRELTAVCGQHFPTYRPAYREIYYASRQSGGGAIQDALTHIINLGEWLVGPVERLVADAAHLVLPGVDVEDTVHVLTRQGPVLGSYALNQHQAPNESMVSVMCDEGTVRCEIHNNRWLWMRKPGDAWQEEPFGASERDTPFIAQAHAFLDAVEGQAPPLCPLVEGLQTLKVNLAILESVERMTWQTIERE